MKPHAIHNSFSSYYVIITFPLYSSRPVLCLFLHSRHSTWRKTWSQPFGEMKMCLKVCGGRCARRSPKLPSAHDKSFAYAKWERHMSSNTTFIIIKWTKVFEEQTTSSKNLNQHKSQYSVQFSCLKRAHTVMSSWYLCTKKRQKYVWHIYPCDVVIVIIVAVRQLRSKCVFVCVSDWQGCDLGTIRMWVSCFQFRHRGKQQPSCIWRRKTFDATLKVCFIEE